MMSILSDRDKTAELPFSSLGHPGSVDRMGVRDRRAHPRRVDLFNPDPPSVKQQAFWSVTTHAVILFSGVISSVVVNRLLMPEGRGQAAAIMLWPPLLATLGAAGWANANTWYVSRYPHKARAVWSSTMIAGMLLSAAIVAIGYVLLPYVLYQYPGTRAPARLFLLVIPLHIAIMATTSVLEGLGLFNKTLWIRAGLALTSLAFILLYASNAGLNPVAYSMLVLAANCVVAVGSVWHLAASTSGEWHPEWSTRPAFVLRTAPQTWACALYERSDLILLTSFLSLDAASFGVFVASTSVARLLAPVTTGVAKVLLPASARRSPSQAIQLFRKTAGLFAVAAALGLLPLVCFAPEILSLAFGDAYASGAVFLQIAMFHGLFAGVLAFGNSTLQGLGVPGMATYVQVFSILMGLFIAIALLFPLGCSGVLIGKAAGVLLGVVLLFKMLTQLSPHTRTSVRAG